MRIGRVARGVCIWLGFALCVSACGSLDSKFGASTADGGGSPGDGGRDGGARDGGADAGTGLRDAGSALDGGRDAGVMTADAGAPMTSMRLETRGQRITRADGTPLEFRGVISCCGGGYGWPLFDEAWVDYTTRYGANFVHMRLGPFLTGGGGEPDWAVVGGAYEERDGKADLSRWNSRFWSRVRALLAYARARGVYVEVDVIDGWAIKHCRWGDIPGYSAWDAAYNHQGEDACSAAGSAAIVPQSVHDRFVRKVVLETGAFDNVVYQDGNEIGLVSGYRVAWTRSMHGILREVERERGFPRHLFGTQSERSDAMAAAEVDYIEFHGTPLDASECFGKPCLVNEYNPRPPLSPQDLHALYCQALRQGTYFWYWRHEQDAAHMDDTLALLEGGCR